MNLPKEMQEAISAPDIVEKIRTIGKRHNLMIDQVGELIDEVGLVLLGLAKGASFVSDISARLLINSQEAQTIANDVNNEVFSSVKAHMRELEKKSHEQSGSSENDNQDNRQDISAIEAAGGFTVEKSREATNGAANDNGTKLTPEDRPKVLAGLENPTPVKEVKRSKLAEENYSEPLVDHLLNASSASAAENAMPTAQIPEPAKAKLVAPPNLPIVEEPISVPRYGAPEKPVVKPAPKVPPDRPKSSDTYREPIK